MTMSERFVQNFLTIMIARIAMIATPFILVVLGYSASEIWKSVNDRLSAVEANDAKYGSQLQDHEARLKFGAEKADQYADQIERRFNDLTGTLKDVNAQIGSINGSIIRLQTTIENRLPPRQAKADPEPDTTIPQQ